MEKRLIVVAETVKVTKKPDKPGPIKSGKLLPSPHSKMEQSVSCWPRQIAPIGNGVRRAKDCSGLRHPTSDVRW